MRMPSLLKEVWSNLLKRPFTTKYPFERLKVPEAFRGRHILVRERCTGCGLCSKVCPSFAISMKTEGDRAFPVIDLGKCIFCYQCEDSCPRGAIVRGKLYELATWRREELVIGYE